jgi:hypothetical protein
MYCKHLTLRYCTYKFCQNGLSPVMHDIINIPNTGLWFKKISL